jgi:hypothetical protein
MVCLCYNKPFIFHYLPKEILTFIKFHGKNSFARWYNVLIDAGFWIALRVQLSDANVQQEQPLLELTDSLVQEAFLKRRRFIILEEVIKLNICWR